MDETRIISLDPGGTTGYTIAYMFDQKNVVCEPKQAIFDVENLWDLLDGFSPRYIIMEDFEFRQKSRAGLNLFPVQLIGIASLYELKAKHQCSLKLQKASQGKGYYTDNILKKYGFYKRGLPHGMDSLRHLLHWLTFGAGYQFLENKKIEDFVVVKI